MKKLSLFGTASRSSASSWIVKTAACFILPLALTLLTVTFVIDPYGEFRLFETAFNTIKQKTRRSSASLILSQLEEKPHSLVFGSSRSYLLSSENMGEDILNLSTTVYKYPVDILAFLHLLSPQQIANINTVYILADDRFLNDDPRYFDISSALELRLDAIFNTDFAKLKDAVSTVQHNLAVQNNPDLFEREVRPEGGMREKLIIGTSKSNITTDPSPQAIAALDAVLAFLRTHHKKVVLHTAPWDIEELFMPHFSWANHYYQGKLLLQHVDSYYDFTDALTDHGKDIFSNGNHVNTAGAELFAKLLKELPLRNKVTAGNFDSFYHDKLTPEAALWVSLMPYAQQPETITSDVAKANWANLMTLATYTDNDRLLKALITLDATKLTDSKWLHLAARTGYRADHFWKPLGIPALAQLTSQQSATLIFETMRHSPRLSKMLISHAIQHDFFDQIQSHVQSELFYEAAGRDKRLATLFQSLGANINAPSKLAHGLTPLGGSIYFDKPDITNYLLSIGADPNTPDARGFTPLIYAAYKGNTELAMELVRRGADPKYFGNGHTPASTARMRGFPKLAELIEQLARTK